MTNIEISDRMRNRQSMRDVNHRLKCSVSSLEWPLEELASSHRRLALDPDMRFLGTKHVSTGLNSEDKSCHIAHDLCT